MRKDIASKLHELMSKNDDIWLVCVDLGFGLWDKIRDDFPDRFLNTGASEQAASDICVGLALSGKKPILYSITPFLLYRCFETLRTYINHESIPVILLGSGRDQDYHIDGFSHDASDDYFFLHNFHNIQSVWPQNNESAVRTLTEAVNEKKPYYINLRK